ncbi:Serine/threonine-protein phosphatase 7 long form-like [Vitis vinifera]|uniref:Serine/threonine-protein phosphatase 7 long form-like n=1 Tax=Vitis vinifera TaxID=29760 RepID=A0A438GV09_VITVI|nr:Serine/threonine-protein phosphatase 7 long form-like [Vitis vinifera]
MSPLIFFDIVEWHRLEHVLQHFGLIQGISLTSPIDYDFHSIDGHGRPPFDWRLYHEHYVALWEAKGDPIVTAEPIKPHMDYHAPCMTWYHRITHRFITPMDDFGPMRYQATALSAHLLIETMTSIISREGHALEDSDSDAYCTGIVDIIYMATDVMCIIREDYRIPHVEHRGDVPLVQHLTYSNLPSVQPPTSLNPPSAQPPTSSDPPSSTYFGSNQQPPTFLDLPPLQPPTFSNPPSVQIDTSTQLDLPLAIPRGRRGLRRLRLLSPPPPLFPVPTPSQIDVLHVSHVVPATVREEPPKRTRVLVTHRFSHCGDI